MPESSLQGKRLNWKQACEILGCGKTQFYKLINNGRLRGFRIGGARRNLWVYEDDCVKLMNESTKSRS